MIKKCTAFCRRHTDRIEMPCGLDFFCIGKWQDEPWHASKKLVIPFCECAARRNESIELAQLAHTERRLEISHPIIKAEFEHLIMPRWCILGFEERGVARHPMIAKTEQALIVFLAIGSDGATLSGGNRLDWMEAE